MIREIALSRRTLRYELIRKRVKRINLRVRADGSVTVSAPPVMPLEIIEGFLQQKENFLMEAIRKSLESKGAERSCNEGGTVLLWGKPLTLCFEKSGKYSAVQEGAILCLRLRRPEDPAARETALARWEKEQCAKLAGELLDRWYPRLEPFGVPRPTLRFRWAASRWGSCIPKKRAVMLNTCLLAYPEECFEYILLHELCHFLQADHSRKFYAWLERFLPDWRERKRLLKGKT